VGVYGSTNQQVGYLSYTLLCNKAWMACALLDGDVQLQYTHP